MAYVSQSFAPITLADRFAAFAAPVRKSFARRAEYQRVSAQLNALSQRELQDIAVYRSDIKAIAKEAALSL
jgi:uncharacterized protein YjiS (DUF1127 family)